MGAVHQCVLYTYLLSDRKQHKSDKSFRTFFLEPAAYFGNTTIKKNNFFSTFFLDITFAHFYSQVRHSFLCYVIMVTMKRHLYEYYLCEEDYWKNQKRIYSHVVKPLLRNFAFFFWFCLFFSFRIFADSVDSFTCWFPKMVVLDFLAIQQVCETNKKRSRNMIRVVDHIYRFGRIYVNESE